MSRSRRAAPSGGAEWFTKLRNAALAYVACCDLLIEWARSGQAGWAQKCTDGDVQRAVDNLAIALEKAADIEREPRLTLGPPYTFANITGRNAHFAALVLARLVKSRIDVAQHTYATLINDSTRRELLLLAGTKPAPPGFPAPFVMASYDFDAWREAVESEYHRASVAHKSTRTTAKTKPTKRTRKPARKRLSPLESLIKKLRDEVPHGGKRRSFGEIAQIVEDRGYKKRDGTPHDYDSIKAAFYRAADKS